MSGSNYAGRLGRIDRRFAEKLAAESGGAGVELRRFLADLDLVDLRRIEQQPPRDRRAIDLQVRFRELWNRWGHDPAERRRRAEVRAQLLPLLCSLSPEEFDEIRRTPARLIDCSTGGA